MKKRNVLFQTGRSRDYRAFHNTLLSRHLQMGGGIFFKRLKKILLLILLFTMFTSSYSQNCSNLPSEVTGCLISGHESEYVCVGDPEYTVSDLIMAQKLLPYNQALTQPQYLIINGELVINQDYVFAPGSHLLFITSNSYLHIRSTSTLTIDGATLEGCSNMWKDIRVNGVLDIQNSYLADMSRGIRPLTTGPGKITVINNHFTQCKVGIHFQNASGIHQVEKNTFEGGIATKEGYMPYFGIRIESSPPVTIGPDNKFVSYEFRRTPGPVVRQFKAGIIVILTSVTIENSRFEYCGVGINGTYEPGAHKCTILDNTFTSCNHGIFMGMDADIHDNTSLNSGEFAALREARLKDIKVHDNMIFSSEYDIGVTVEDNAIPGLDFNLYKNDNQSSGYSESILVYNRGFPGNSNIYIRNNETTFTSGEGIDISLYQGIAGVVIENNTTTFTSFATPTNDKYRGVYCLLCKAPVVRQNDITGFIPPTIPSGFLSNQQGIYITGAEDGLYSCNNLHKLQTGLVVNGFSPSNVIQNHFEADADGVFISGHHGVQRFHENLWEDGVRPPVFDIEVLNGMGFENRYIVDTDPNNPGPEWPDPVNDPSVRAIGQSETQLSQCGPPAALPVFPDNPSLSMNPYPGDGYAWSADYYRFKFILKHPGLLTEDSSAIAFYNQHVAGDIGFLANIETQWAAMYQFDPTTETTLSTKMEERDTLLSQIQSLYPSWIQDTTGTVDSQMVVLRNQLEAVEQVIQSIRTQQDSSAHQTATALLQDLNGFSSTNIAAQNYSDLMTISLEDFNANDTAWSSQHIAELTLLANQCSADGGKAVLLARSYLDYPESMNDSIFCTGSAPLLATSNKAPETIAVTPNPAENLIKVSWSSGMGNVVLNLMDMTGQLRTMKRVKDGSTSTTLQVSDIPNGVYILQLTKDQELMGATLVSIVK